MLAPGADIFPLASSLGVGARHVHLPRHPFCNFCGAYAVKNMYSQLWLVLRLRAAHWKWLQRALMWQMLWVDLWPRQCSRQMLLLGERCSCGYFILSCSRREVAPFPTHCRSPCFTAIVCCWQQESGGPPLGLQVFVGTLSLFAVPVVAWSLYTLNTTGSITPPLNYIVRKLAVPS